MYSFRLHSVVTIIITAVIFSGCAPQVKIKFGELPAAQAPTIEERQTSKSFVDANIQKGSFKDISGAPLKRVTSIVRKLEMAAGMNAGTLDVSVVDAGDYINASTVSNSRIVMFKGLLDKLKDDNELAAVLGHEVGHALSRHTNKGESERVQKVSVTSSILGGLASIALAATGNGGLSRIGGRMTRTVSNTVGYGSYVRGYDRKQEYEADLIGIFIMAKAGYDPKAAVEFHARESEIFKAGQVSGNAFFSTHPSGEDRVEKLNSVLPEALNIFAESKARSVKSKKA